MSSAGGPDPDSFLSGHSGHVAGLRATGRALVRDAFADVLALGRLERLRLSKAAERMPRRRVLVLAIEHEGVPNLLAETVRELRGTRHLLTVATATTGVLGKFENLNELLGRRPADGYDWLLVVDDDVALPSGFLDSFLFLAERFALVLAQPAHRARSHAAWSVTRRRAGTVARQTAHVEIGPVTAFHRSAFPELLPFPPLRFGWGLDLHWAALARQRGWRIGVVDATPMSHRLRPVASSYPRHDAIAEARAFLRDRPYLHAEEANRTLAGYGSWR